MPLVATEQPVPGRDRLIRTYLNQGALGLALMCLFTWLRAAEVPRVVGGLGPHASILITILVLFAGALSFLKFPLTEEIFVSPAVVAYIAITPLLGLVLSSWIAVLVAATSRSLAMAKIGPTKIGMDDPVLEYARLFGLFGTYGIPVIGAALVYERLGGTVPMSDTSIDAGMRMGASLLVFMALNVAVMYRVQGALGYVHRTRAKMAIVDTSLYVLALPYSVLVPYSWVALGFRGVALAVFTGVAGTVIVRSLASASSANKQLVSRLSSLSNIAAAVSLNLNRDELLRAIWVECGKVMDVSLFSIAVLDEEKRELRFDFDICNEERLPPSSIPLGEGLNSWVVENRRPLLLRSTKEEDALHLRSIEDGVPSESWLGVPMIVQDRIIGVISLQSLRKKAFTDDDVVLMMAVASQAAAVIEDSNLFQNLENLNTELESRVVERTDDLRKTNLQLQAADRAKTRYLANMSHELRTPLNAIIGFSDVVRNKARDVLSPQMHRFVENIFESGTHLLGLINDILDLSKVEAGKVRLQIDSFDIREVVATVERVMKGVAAETKVAIDVVMDEHLSEVRMDEGRFKQVLLNLLSNAVKFSPVGGSVRIELQHLEADDSSLGCETVRLVVEDHGVGIPPAELPRIFEEFYQVEVSGVTQKPGTGLGLPLTRSLVELHHGTISVESQVGEGTTFVVELPLHADVEIERHLGSAAAERRSGVRRAF